MENLLYIIRPLNYRKMILISSSEIQIPSYLDLKIGTNCVKFPPLHKKYQQYRQIDLDTTTSEYGFRITGYCFYEGNRIVGYDCEKNEITNSY